MCSPIVFGVFLRWSLGLCVGWVGCLVLSRDWQSSIFVMCFVISPLFSSRYCWDCNWRAMGLISLFPWFGLSLLYRDGCLFRCTVYSLRACRVVFFWRANLLSSLDFHMLLSWTLHYLAILDITGWSQCLWTDLHSSFHESTEACLTCRRFFAAPLRSYLLHICANLVVHGQNSQSM